MVEMVEKKMTPEIQKKLMGFNTVSKKHGVPFTPDHYMKDEELKPFWPVFMQRGWTEEEREILVSSLEEKVAASERQKRGMELTRITIVGMENYYDIGTKEKISFVEDKENGCLVKEIFNEFPQILHMALLHNARKVSGIPGGRAELQPEEKESLES